MLRRAVPQCPYKAKRCFLTYHKWNGNNLFHLQQAASNSFDLTPRSPPQQCRRSVVTNQSARPFKYSLLILFLILLCFLFYYFVCCCCCLHVGHLPRFILLLLVLVDWWWRLWWYWLVLNRFWLHTYVVVHTYKHTYRRCIFISCFFLFLFAGSLCYFGHFDGLCRRCIWKLFVAFKHLVNTYYIHTYVQLYNKKKIKIRCCCSPFAVGCTSRDSCNDGGGRPPCAVGDLLLWNAIASY